MSQRHESILHTIKTLKGNERACLYTEPMWGIPYGLFVPFVSVYMAGIGLTPVLIGVIATISLISQVIWSVLGGVLTDKFGRRLTTLIFDIIAWVIPAFLWMIAQDYRYFILAALFNGACRVTENSWTLLLIEDAREEKLIRIFSIMQISAHISGFFAPIAYYFVQRYDMVPTVRWLYGFFLVSMILKILFVYIFSRETSVGLRRMQENRGKNVLHRLWDSRKVLYTMLKSRRIMLTIAFITCFTGLRSVTDMFWPLLVTGHLGIASENLSIFSTIKTLLMLSSYVFLVPRLNLRRFRNPVGLGLALFVAMGITMLFMPQGVFWLVLVTVLMEGAALSLLIPFSSGLQMVNVDREERARMLGFFYAISMLLTSPLTTIAGLLANLSPALPFVLILMLAAAAFLLTQKLWAMDQAETISESA
ncbi:MAG TPA: MFS transporter [Candidatus Limiplasma sp.]|nr:MFS transporter [Candidatus Limiplasma sp.]HRX07914.1 MFS transporter [Candidatus Limiplasma sp.]